MLDHATRKPVIAKFGTVTGSVFLMRPSAHAEKGNFLVINVYATPSPNVEPYTQPTMIIPVSETFANTWEARIREFKKQHSGSKQAPN